MEPPFASQNNFGAALNDEDDAGDAGDDNEDDYVDDDEGAEDDDDEDDDDYDDGDDEGNDLYGDEDRIEESRMRKEWENKEEAEGRSEVFNEKGKKEVA